jgi:hypothetical protein
VRHPPPTAWSRADVAQLVAHHLAKVRVAGSSPVVRSERGRGGLNLGGVAERRGNGLQSRVHGFESRLHLGMTAQRAISSVGEHFLDTEGVTGSIPVSPTTHNRRSAPVFTGAFCCPRHLRVTARSSKMTLCDSHRRACNLPKRKRRASREDKVGADWRPGQSSVVTRATVSRQVASPASELVVRV